MLSTLPQSVLSLTKILQRLGMTDLSDSMLPLSTPESSKRLKQYSSLVVANAEGEPMTIELKHLNFKDLETLDSDARMALLRSGHV